MPWLPEDYSDTAEFLASPITFPFTFGYAMAYYISDSDMPAPDWQASARNYGIWSSIVGVNWAYHMIMHPGKYSFISAKGAFHVASKLLPGPVYVAAVAVGSAVGWAATAEHHGAVAPGMGMGMPMTPELYSQGSASNPAGWDLSTWWSNIV